jgi:phosphopantetheinyl transferase (holo-ACP synthase)
MSTGNDIVALVATDSHRTSLSRFYSRILSPDEQTLFRQVAGEGSGGLSFSSFVWLLWSIKESVYKYVSRSNPRLVFAPLKIPVSRLGRKDGYYEGLICYDPYLLYSRSFLRDETILTVVSEEKNFRHTRWGLRYIGDSDRASQSAWVRTFALESLSTDFPGAPLRIVNTMDGLPVVWTGHRTLGIPLSLAHHDRWVAWSYRLSRLTANSSS